jgi:hypothetical protein
MPFAKGTIVSVTSISSTTSKAYFQRARDRQNEKRVSPSPPPHAKEGTVLLSVDCVRDTRHFVANSTFKPQLEQKLTKTEQISLNWSIGPMRLVFMLTTRAQKQKQPLDSQSDRRYDK